MDECMIANWNAVVRPDDTVIHLGDFAHRAEPARLEKLFARLRGRKHLIRGNHDGRETQALAWESQRDIAFASIDSQNVVLCHYALRTWPKIRKGALMLYGHSHGRLPGNTQSADIGVDVLGFAPLRLNQIKDYLSTLPLLVDPESGVDLDDDHSARRTI
jgi:calcineurin-like phosphoesterase family protein